MAKFKVGDKVRSENTGFTHMKRLNLGVVESVEELGIYKVKVIKWESALGNTQNWPEKTWAFKEEELMPTRLQVGQRVRFVDCPALRGWIRAREALEAKEGVITFGFADGVTCFIDDNKYYINFTTEMLEPIGGGHMGKYEELKARIDGLKDGWTKEADDILQEMGMEHKYICIVVNNGNGGGAINGVEIQDKYRNPLTKLGFYDQCSKMKAFKQALLWLLDQSSIKKEETIVGKEVKAEIEGKVYKVKVLKEV